jgi:hypothetical protein
MIETETENLVGDAVFSSLSFLRIRSFPGFPL